MGILEICDAILYPYWNMMGGDDNIGEIHTTDGLYQSNLSILKNSFFSLA